MDVAAAGTRMFPGFANMSKYPTDDLGVSTKLPAMGLQPVAERIYSQWLSNDLRLPSSEPIPAVRKQTQDGGPQPSPRSLVLGSPHTEAWANHRKIGRWPNRPVHEGDEILRAFESRVEPMLDPREKRPSLDFVLGFRGRSLRLVGLHALSTRTGFLTRLRRAPAKNSPELKPASHVRVRVSLGERTPVTASRPSWGERIANERWIVLGRAFGLRWTASGETGPKCRET